jgi:hypothetical protein
LTLAGRAIQLPWTRSRPYRKNDNAHCEQKNWTHVRQLFGHQRFGHPELVPLMNDLRATEWSQFTGATGWHPPSGWRRTPQGKLATFWTFWKFGLVCSRDRPAWRLCALRRYLTSSPSS